MALLNSQLRPRHFLLALLSILVLVSLSVNSFREGHIVAGLTLAGFLVVVMWLFFPAIRSFYGQQRQWVLLILIGGPVLWVSIVELGDFASRRMDLYVYAMSDLATSGRDAEIFGGHLTVGWPIGISSEASSDAGHAELDVPLSGDKAKGRLIIVGTKSAGLWAIDDLYVLQHGSSSKIQVPH